MALLNIQLLILLFYLKAKPVDNQTLDQLTAPLQKIRNKVKGFGVSDKKKPIVNDDNRAFCVENDL